MRRSRKIIKLATAVALIASTPVTAQQPPAGAGWQAGIEKPPAPPPETVIQKSLPQRDTPGTTKPAAQPGDSAVTLVALLTEDGQQIDQGMVWHVFEETAGTDGRGTRLITTSRAASPRLSLAPGRYVVSASFGRAHLTRRVTVPQNGATVERFVLNAGGLRLTAELASGEAITPNTVSFEIFSDERDQAGKRTRIIGPTRPGVIIRLNSGIYHVVSTYGDANATVRADVTVESGKLTEATVTHTAAKVTFKLVTRAGGEALADTQWSIAAADGTIVKESAGAFPTHMLAPGVYRAIARSGKRVYQRDFAVQAGDISQVEVVIK